MTDFNDEDDGDVPPLEDMTEQLSLHSKQRATRSSTYLEPSSSSSDKRTGLVKKLLDEKKPQNSVIDDKKDNVAQKSSKPSTYCGFKKGFLLSKQSKTTESAEKGSAENKKTNSGASGIVEIKTNSSSKTERNVLPEVQEAMMQKNPLLQTDKWLTEDLLTKIAKHPKLSKQIMDPRYSQALSLFQNDPEKAMQLCQQNPEMKEFIQEFSALMGDHFTDLSSKENDSMKSKSNSKVKEEKDFVLRETAKQPKSNSVEDAQVQSILSDPKMLSILQDEQVQQMMSLLRTEPQKAHMFLQKGGRELQEKVQCLVQAGLLQVQR